MKFFYLPNQEWSEIDSESHLLELEEICFPESNWTRPMIRSHLATHRAILGFIDNKLMGYCLFTENDWELEILRIGVHPEFRRQGRGESLIHNLAIHHPTKEIFLEVDSKNFSAIHLYEKSKFQLLDKRKGYYQNGNDALLYKRNSAEFLNQ